MKHSKSTTYLHCIFFLLIFSTCIQRNNPWDPVNGCPGDFRKEIQEKSLPEFKSYASDASLSLNQLHKQISKIDSLNALNDSVHSIFKSVQKKLDSVYALNKSIDSLNRIDCKMLKNKVKADIFPSMTFFSDTVDIKDFRASMSDDSLRTVTGISVDNNQCRPHGIYSKEFQDSVIDFYDSLNTGADSLVEYFKQFNNRVTDTNSRIITEKNRDITFYNAAVDTYNDSIKIVMEYCKTDWLSDPDEIKKQKDSIQPGDTLSIDSGTYTVELKFNDRGNQDKPIIIQGSPFGTTKLLYPDFLISKCRNIIVRNLTFVNATSRGLTIADNSSDIWLKHCYITGSANNGLELLNSSVSVDSCEFTDNNYGINCIGPNAKLEIKNVLIARNRGHGIFCNYSELSISRATISDNLNSGIHLKDQRNSMSIVSSLLTYNGTYGLERALTDDTYEVTFYHSVFFGNGTGDFTGDSTKIIIDISCKNGDPRYTNREQNDYTILNSEFKILGYTH